VDGKGQLATAQISAIDIPLDQAQEEAILLVEWDLTSTGHCKSLQASVITSTIQWDSLCLVTGSP